MCTEVLVTLVLNNGDKRQRIKLVWSSFEKKTSDDVTSIIDLVEKYSDSTKQEFLQINKGLDEVFSQNCNLEISGSKNYQSNVWWMGLISEKSNGYKSKHINDQLKFLAFCNWAKDKRIQKISISTDRPEIYRCFKIWSAKNGIHFKGNWLNPKLVCKHFGKKQNFPGYHLLSALIWLLVYVVRRWPVRNAGMETWVASSAKVTIVNYLLGNDLDDAKKGRFSPLHWGPLPRLLFETQLESRWLHLWQRDGFISTSKEYRTWINSLNETNKNKQVHVALETFLSPNIIFQTLRQWFLMRLKWTKNLRKFENVSRLQSSLAPFIKNDLRSSLLGQNLIENILRIHLFDAALSDIPTQDKGVFLQENQGWEAGFICAWNNLCHKEIFGYVHSTVRYWDLRYWKFSGVQNHPNSPDMTLVNNEPAYFLLKSADMPNAVTKVEPLRYLETVRLSKTKKATKVNRPNSQQNKKLLVLGEYEKEDLNIQFQFLESLSLQSSKDWEIFIKPHPAAQIPDAWHSKLRFNITNSTIVDCYQDATVVFCGPSSSASVDAYVLGKPVIIALNPAAPNFSPLRGFPSVKFVSDVTDFKRQCDSMITRAPSETSKFFVDSFSMQRWRAVLLNSIQYK